MACRLFGAKPLSKPMLGYCQLDHQEQTSVKFKMKYKTFHSRKCIWKYRLRNGGHFLQGEMTQMGLFMISDRFLQTGMIEKVESFSVRRLNAQPPCLAKAAHRTETRSGGSLWTAHYRGHYPAYVCWVPACDWPCRFRKQTWWQGTVPGVWRTLSSSLV